MIINQKHMIISAALLLSVLVFSLMVFILLRLISSPERSFEPALQPRSIETGPVPGYSIDISDYLIPDEYKAQPGFNWIPYRRIGEAWSSEEADRFWTAPAEIVRDMYADISSGEMERILEEIP